MCLHEHSIFVHSVSILNWMLDVYPSIFTALFDVAVFTLTLSYIYICSTSLHFKTQNYALSVPFLDTVVCCPTNICIAIDKSIIVNVLLYKCTTRKTKKKVHQHQQWRQNINWKTFKIRITMCYMTEGWINLFNKRSM